MQGFWKVIAPGREEFVPYQYTTVNIQPESTAAPFPTQPIVQQPVQQQAVAQPPAVQPPAQPQVQQSKVAAWEMALRKMLDPKIMGPLQTFLGAMSVPLSSGETMGSRLGYASTLMRMHQRMLEENERNIPLQQRQKELELEKAEVEARKLKSAADYEERSLGGRLDKLQQELARAKNENEVRRIEKQLKDIELQLAQEFGREEAKLKLQNIQQNIRTQRAQEGMYNRSPKVSGEASNTASTNNLDALRRRYEVEIFMPYRNWAAEKRRLDPTSDVSWATFLKEYPQMAVIYRQWSNEFSKAGGQLTTRELEEPKVKKRITAEEYLKGK